MAQADVEQGMRPQNRNSNVTMTLGPPSKLPGVLGMRQLECGPGGAAEAVLPDAYVILSLQYGEAVTSDEGAGPRLLRSHLTGLHVRRVDVRAPEAARALLVKLRPAAAARLLGVETAEIAGLSLSLEDVVGRAAADRLEDRLAQAGGAQERFAIVEAFLAPRLADAPGRDGLGHAAFDLMVAHDGAVRIDAVAEELDVSARWLEQRFAAAVGLTPKAVARVLRLQAALKGRATGLHWSAVAADAGFADQAHLTREFRAMVGASPMDFYRRVARLDDHALNRETSRSDFFNTFFL